MGGRGPVGDPAQQLSSIYIHKYGYSGPKTGILAENLPKIADFYFRTTFLLFDLGLFPLRCFEVYDKI